MGSLHAQHDCAHYLALGDRVERRCDLRQRIDCLNMGAELACGAPRHDVGHQFALRKRLAVGPGPPGYAADIAAFKKGEVQRDFWNFAGGKADHEITAEPAERAERWFGIAAADRIVDNVDAAFAAELSQ